MFTRSAKRVPTSFSEGNSDDNFNIDATTKMETKSKRRRKKENVSENSSLDTKKRVNYVSYPSDLEGIMINENCADITMDTTKKVHKKKSNKVVLKELNANHSNSDEVVKRKVTRSTHQTKIMNNDNEDISTSVDIVKKSKKAKISDADIESVGMKTITEGNAKKGKKKKKSKDSSMSEAVTAGIEHVPVINKKGKKKKKGKRSESSTVPINLVGENSPSNLEKSSASIDSFHSAAGSPVSNAVNGFGDINNINVSKSKEIYELNTTDNKEKSTRRRKSSIKNVIHNGLSPVVCLETLDVTKSHEIDKSTVSDGHVKKSKKRKSSIIHDADSEKSNDEIKTDNDLVVLKTNLSHHSAESDGIQAYITQEINESNINDKSDLGRKQRKKSKRKSSIKNDTINISSSKCKDDTFDKSNNISVAMDHMRQEFQEEISQIGKASATKQQRYSARLSNCVPEDKMAVKNMSNKTSQIVPDKKDSKLDITFEKSDNKTSTKSSLISSDGTLNVTYDKSDSMHISITSDDSRSENIVNTTPMLIESSLDETNLQNTPKKASVTPQPKPTTTPLKREGTFTKDGPDMMSPKLKQNPETPNKKLSGTPKVSLERTPTHRRSIGTPGSTPFPFSKISQKESVLLNVTRSIEKQTRRSSLAATIPIRTTRVMFCSPLDNQVPNTEAKRKIVKSSLKGSNKSFVFDDSITAVRAGSRKRSFSQDAPLSAKRARFTEDSKLAARSRTFSASAKLSTTPAKKAVTPAKVPRTKLPNFAAVHQRRFDKMESLSDCQRRRAKRAQQLLTVAGAVPALEPTTPRAAESAKKLVLEASARKSERKPKPKSEAPLKPEAQPKQEVKTKAVSTLASLGKGYTRFGFKMDIGVNPFSVRTENKKEKPVARKPLPSRSTAPVRKDAAQQIVMGQKPSLSKRSETTRMENRTHIKGVRTNRRFDLQMKMRGVDG